MTSDTNFYQVGNNQSLQIEHTGLEPILDKAGAIKRTRRSHFQITDRGKRLLADNPTRIDVQVLKKFPEFIAFQTPKAIDETTASSIAPPSIAALYRRHP